MPEERISGDIAPAAYENRKEEVREFLQALTELSKEYGIVIAGCGHCHSPWLEETAIAPQFKIAWDLHWNKEMQRYEVNNRGDNLESDEEGDDRCEGL